MYDELIAFIGLIVLELKNQIKLQSQLADEYMVYEFKNEINNIISRLYKIQEDLTDPSSYENANCTYIKTWEKDYLLSTDQMNQVKREHPVGYCFVARAICRRLKPSLICIHLYSFLETLGYYINYNYEL